MDTQNKVESIPISELSLSAKKKKKIFITCLVIGILCIAFSVLSFNDIKRIGNAVGDLKSLQIEGDHFGMGQEHHDSLQNDIRQGERNIIKSLNQGVISGALGLILLIIAFGNLSKYKRMKAISKTQIQ